MKQRIFLFALTLALTWAFAGTQAQAPPAPDIGDKTAFVVLPLDGDYSSEFVAGTARPALQEWPLLAYKLAETQWQAPISNFGTSQGGTGRLCGFGVIHNEANPAKTQALAANSRHPRDGLSCN